MPMVETLYVIHLALSCEWDFQTNAILYDVMMFNKNLRMSEIKPLMIIIICKW